jgi:pilus assembly protein TadC
MMVQEDLGLVDRIVKSTTKPLIISSIVIGIVGGYIGLKNATPDTYRKAGAILGGLSSFYLPAALLERYFERRNKRINSEKRENYREAANL